MGAVLKELALEQSNESRFELLLRLSDYVDGRQAALEDDSKDDYTEICGLLLDQVALEERAAFSKKAALYDWLPVKLALKLAQDEYAVAQPILEAGMRLSEKELIDIARKKTVAHRQALARRTDLGEALFDQLIELAEEKVFLELLNNEAAKARLPVYQKLIENCRGMKSLQERLVLSREIPAADFEALGKMVDGSLRLRYVAQKNKRKSG